MQQKNLKKKKILYFEMEHSKGQDKHTHTVGLNSVLNGSKTRLKHRTIESFL